jgi:hypothetical protein
MPNAIVVNSCQRLLTVEKQYSSIEYSLRVYNKYHNSQCFFAGSSISQEPLSVVAFRCGVWFLRQVDAVTGFQCRATRTAHQFDEGGLV